MPPTRAAVLPGLADQEAAGEAWSRLAQLGVPMSCHWPWPRCSSAPRRGGTAAASNCLAARIPGRDTPMPEKVRPDVGLATTSGGRSDLRWPRPGWYRLGGIAHEREIASRALGCGFGTRIRRLPWRVGRQAPVVRKSVQTPLLTTTNALVYRQFFSCKMPQSPYPERAQHRPVAGIGEAVAAARRAR